MPRWFVLSLAACFVVGLGVRLVYTFGTQVPEEPGYLVNFDPISYHRQANDLIDGRGFIAQYADDGRPSAIHPPMLSLALAVASAVGSDSFLSHRVVTALLGALAVPLVALLGARLAGWRAGGVAGAIAAVHPGLWANDGLLMPESLYATIAAAALLLAYRAMDRYTTWVAVALGIVLGVGILTRGEAVLAYPFLVLPIAVRARGLATTRRIAVFAITLGAGAAVVLPWSVYNLGRFDKPVPVSTAMQFLVGGANCESGYSGDGIGFWQFECYQNVSMNRDESVWADEVMRQGVQYARTHPARLPLVGAVRLARVWDLYSPGDAITSNDLQNRPRPVGWAALLAYYALVPFAVAGFVVLVRRRVTVVPLVGSIVFVSVTAVLAYGNVRFRVPGEITVVALAAVSIDALVRRR